MSMTQLSLDATPIDFCVIEILEKFVGKLIKVIAQIEYKRVINPISKKH